MSGKPRRSISSGIYGALGGFLYAGATEDYFIVQNGRVVDLGGFMAV